MLSSSSVVEAVEEGAGAFGFGSSTSRSVSVSGSSFEYMGLARLLFFCRILVVLVNIAGGARVWSVLGLVTECSGFPLARGSSLYRTSGAVGACRDLSRLPDILWGGGWLLCGCLVVFGGGGVWCSLCQLCTATGLSVKILKFRLHEAEQGVLFEGEAVGGTCKEGVVGWGCSRCRSQRLKLSDNHIPETNFRK